MAKEHINAGAKISKLFSILPGTHHDKPEEAQNSGIPEPKMLFFIIDWNRVKNIAKVFEEKKVNFYFISKGTGTATSEILDILGIGAADKAVVTCLELPEMVPVLLKDVRKELGSRSPGAGISFTVPISGINTPVLRIFKNAGGEKPNTEESSPGKPQNGVERRAIPAYDLIISVVNNGYSGSLMNTARTAGAGGGTVINARGQTNIGVVKFFGISVQAEREMILILTSREKKMPIMEAVYKAHGPDSKAQGVIFSLPVERVMSLSFEQALNA